MSRPHPFFFLCVLLAIAIASLFPRIQTEFQSIVLERNGNVNSHAHTEQPRPLDWQKLDKHQQEKLRLLNRLKRNGDGKWNSSQPRYRLLEALHGFYRYKNRNIAELDRWRDLYRKMPRRQRLFLDPVVGYTSKVSTVERLFEVNDVLSQEILDHALEYYGVERTELEEFVKETEASGKQADKTSTSQALKHFVRDWSEEGVHERKTAFSCILHTLSSLFSSRSDKSPIHVLIPGSGLGRLAHDVAALGGFDVMSNEWSSHMNVAYRYLETLQRQNSRLFHPFIDWWSHQATTRDLLRPVTFPDISPPNTSSSVLHVEGDFTTVFQDTPAGSYDVIVTFFFIDTARNLMNYLETIHRLLKSKEQSNSGGGVWINFGPLMYGSAPFLQLSLDELVGVSEKMGFQFLDTNPMCGDITLDGRKVRGKELAYGMSERSLSKNAYKAQFWAAQKSK